jgi:hypothetical protein
VTAFFMAEPDPEEVDRAHAAHTAGSHAVNRMLDELSEEHFSAVMLVLDSIAVSNNPIRVASYMSGRMTQLAQIRFGVCAACNKNHDKEAEELLAKPTDDKPEKPPFVEARERTDEVTFTQIGSTEILTPREIELMHEYGLDDLREEGTGKLIGFMCLNCKMNYPAIQDRMLREPGVANCAGCVHKTQWG